MPRAIARGSREAPLGFLCAAPWLTIRRRTFDPRSARSQYRHRARKTGASRQRAQRHRHWRDVGFQNPSHFARIFRNPGGSAVALAIIRRHCRASPAPAPPGSQGPMAGSTPGVSPFGMGHRVAAWSSNMRADRRPRLTIKTLAACRPSSRSTATARSVSIGALVFMSSCLCASARGLGPVAANSPISGPIKPSDGKGPSRVAPPASGPSSANWTTRPASGLRHRTGRAGPCPGQPTDRNAGSRIGGRGDRRRPK
jgi:hypothetical protein